MATLQDLDAYLSKPVVAGLTGKCLLKMTALFGAGFFAGRVTSPACAPASGPQTLVLTMQPPVYTVR